MKRKKLSTVTERELAAAESAQPRTQRQHQLQQPQQQFLGGLQQLQQQQQPPPYASRTTAEMRQFGAVSNSQQLDCRWLHQQQQRRRLSTGAEREPQGSAVAMPSPSFRDEGGPGEQPQLRKWQRLAGSDGNDGDDECDSSEAESGDDDCGRDDGVIDHFRSEPSGSGGGGACGIFPGAPWWRSAEARRAAEEGVVDDGEPSSDSDGDPCQGSSSAWIQLQRREWLRRQMMLQHIEAVRRQRVQHDNWTGADHLGQRYQTQVRVPRPPQRVPTPPWRTL